MAIKNYKPTTPSRRNMSVSTFEELSKTEPEKSLLSPLSHKSGRNMLAAVVNGYCMTHKFRIYR